MTPKISVNPAAMRNSMTPNCRPFSTCSMKSAKVKSLVPRQAVSRGSILTSPEGDLYETPYSASPRPKVSACRDVLLIATRQASLTVKVREPGPTRSLLRPAQCLPNREWVPDSPLGFRDDEEKGPTCRRGLP